MDIMFLIKFYATMIVIVMTMDTIRPFAAQFHSLSWFFDWGCLAICIVLSAMVTYCELEGIKLE
jgi:hypothetical protein